jgi:UDP-sulfoquinovose synthase
VLGGDGFCGWPTSLYLSERGHDITIIDNLSRRKLDVELEVESLTPIRPIGERLRVWREVADRDIGYVNFDLATGYDRLAGLLSELRRTRSCTSPSSVRLLLYAVRASQAVHGRQQRAGYPQPADGAGRHRHRRCRRAPRHDGRLRLRLVRQRAHPRGYLTVKVPTPDGELGREILHPANPGSVYHLTKTLDQLMFSFYAKNDRLRITDLHQGIVWGTQTDQTSRDERLINRFDYDGD